MARGIFRSYERTSDTYLVGIDRAVTLGRVRRTEAGFEFIPFFDCLWQLEPIISRTMQEMMEAVCIGYDRSRDREIRGIAARQLAAEAGLNPPPYCPPEIMVSPLCRDEEARRDAERYGGM